MTKLVKPQNWEKVYTFVHFRALPQGKQWGAVSSGLAVQDPGEARGLRDFVPLSGDLPLRVGGEGHRKSLGVLEPQPG